MSDEPQCRREDREKKGHCCFCGVRLMYVRSGFGDETTAYDMSDLIRNDPRHLCFTCSTIASDIERDTLEEMNEAHQKSRVPPKDSLIVECLQANVQSLMQANIDLKAARSRDQQRIVDLERNLTDAIEFGGNAQVTAARLSRIEKVVRAEIENGCSEVGGSRTHSVCEPSGYPREDWCTACRLRVALQPENEE